MKMTLNLVSYGYEFSFDDDDSFICRDFGNDFLDQERLELAAKIALMKMVEEQFEDRIELIYEFLKQSS